MNLREGDNSEQIAGPAVGLVDAETDEIHFVIRSHGAPIPGMIGEQILTVAGGCSPSNPCSNVAVTVFK